MELLDKLNDIHMSLNFSDSNELKREIPEQLMVLKHLNKNDIVLELGGSIGRNSCIISNILNDSKNLVTIEPSPYEYKILENNRKLNNFNFKIETNVL